MPKRLLFVDDEPMVLDGLRRALRDMRFEWEMRFVGSGKTALEELDRERYDAIITDMRMPEMDGAQLLEEVKNRHEDIVRVVLSGHSSQEAVMRSVVPTHQFLSKPCDTEELKLRLSLAFSMRDALANGTLKAMVARLRSIPSLPILYDEITRALASASTSLEQLEVIIKKDVGMAAKILQLANSAFIGARSEVSSLRQAVSLIGTDAIRTLVLSVHIFSQFERSSSVRSYLPALWEHSVEAAALARKIASAEDQPGSVKEQSFTATLLHDIGRAILLSELPSDYIPILKGAATDPGSVLSLELEKFGCTHAQVGAYLMSIWGLPAALVHAVALHHRPSEDAQSHFSPLTAVHCADVITTTDDDRASVRDGELDVAYLERLGLSERLAVWQGLHRDLVVANNERRFL